MTAKNPEAEAEPKSVRLTRTRRAALLKALADPRRFEILEQIAKNNCESSCSKLNSCSKITAATLSHHLKELSVAGLIDARRDGKYRFFSLRPGVLSALAEQLLALETHSRRKS